MIDTSKQVRAAIAYAGFSVSRAAHGAGFSPQNLNQRLARNGLRPADLEKIAESLGCKYHSYFEFPDGKEI